MAKQYDYFRTETSKTASADATHAIWQDPTSYDPITQGPPYLPERTASEKKTEVGKLLSKTASGKTEVINKIATSLTEPSLGLLGVLVLLKALSAIHQSFHWQSSGKEYYGDHLLFERLYSETDGEIDGVAERAVGLGGVLIANPATLAIKVAHIVDVLAPSAPGFTTAMARAETALQAESRFLVILKVVADKLKDAGTLSRGTDNLLAGIEDKHETHIYLLQQRLSTL